MDTPEGIGTATITEESGALASAVRTDGEVTERTLEMLQSGDKPMSAAAVERLRVQAQELVGDIVDVYTRDVAPGEVGVGGSGRASPEPPRSGTCPTGLLYGRIQSGKTAAMIVSSAMAIDNGFRVIIVLTANYEKLVDQTAKRFRVLALDGPLVYSSNERTGSEYVWDTDAENISRNVAQHGVVIVCAKAAVHQRALLRRLQALGADGYPALILDDEADQATPDTTTNARAQQRASAPQQASTTYRLSVESGDDDEVESFREVLRHNLYLQVTATPYALLLQNITSPLRPSFTRLLEPGDGYTGGERFFTAEQVEARPFLPPLVEVDENESHHLESGVAVAPEGLQKAIAFFLLSASARSLLAPSASDMTGYKFLCHTSPRNIEHDRLSRLIRDFVDELFVDPSSERLFAEAYEQLRRTLLDAPPLAELMSRVQRRRHYRKIIVVNAVGSSLDFGPAANFLIGGNILGRGLTIDNLLVTYYLRRAKTTQMDTMLQHARMYGYREQLMPFTRVFLPETLAARFSRLHEAERDLRDQLRDPDTRKSVVVKVANQLRPTRPAVLDVGSIAAYRPGQQLYPTEPKYTAEDLGTTTERISSIASDAMGGELTRLEFAPLPIERMAEVIETVRTHDEELGDWDQEALVRVLRALAPDYDGNGLLWLRDAPERRGPRLPQGALSGADQQRARNQTRPVLFLTWFRGDREKGWDGVSFWYPTIVFPGDMANWVFNVTRR
jgi:hypothetical protein